MLDIFDLEKNLVFYCSYHLNEFNKAIHIVFVPLIAWTTMVFLQYVGPLFLMVVADIEVFITMSDVLALALFLYYVALERNFAGVSSGLLLYLGTSSARTFVFVVGPQDAWLYALTLHLLSWAAQFFGHAMFEGRAPALRDSIFQSLVMAPFFVYMEVLAEIFGYRIMLSKRVHQAAHRRIAIQHSGKTGDSAAKQE
eukprot:GFYU01022632.1.p1 GENE.GFYU01022632.1~~GFYU01022632.1.p1  ORF type:complete len:197 (+),score=33.68 GFYU01022632.1:28-618(+)